MSGQRTGFLRVPRDLLARLQQDCEHLQRLIKLHPDALKALSDDAKRAEGILDEHSIRIEDICATLPEGWELTVVFDSSGWAIELADPDGNCVDIPVINLQDTLVERVKFAVEFARAAADAE